MVNQTTKQADSSFIQRLFGKKQKQLKPGWFKRARRKFISTRVYSFYLRSNSGFYGSYKCEYTLWSKHWYEYGEHEFYRHIQAYNNFVDRFLYAKMLSIRENYDFSYELKSDKQINPDNYGK